MLNFAFAPALWLGLALLPVLVFYFLRLRFRRQPTGSTFLWRRLVRPESGGLRLNWKSLLLLILQVIGLLGLIFAAARPVLERSRVEIPGVVFLLDESASMASHEAPDGKTRFRLAADRIVREINNLAPATPVAVFLCAGTALPLETEAGKPRIRTAAEASAIAGLLAGREAGWDAFREEAVSEALRVWESGRSTPWQAVLVTDGGCDLAGSRLAAVFDGRLLVLPMGAPVANLGIAAAWVDGADPSILRYTLRNSSAAPWPASLVLSRDAQSLHRLALTVAPGQTEQSLQLDGPLAPGGYRLELAAANGTALAGDGFGPDDGIWLAVNRRRPLRVLHLGTESPFLRAAFGGDGFRYSSLDAAPGEWASDGWDLVINELETLPGPVPANLLSFAALPPGAPAAWNGRVSGPLVTSSGTHPLMRFVDWQGAVVFMGRSLKPEAGAQAIAECEGQVLALAWEWQGYRQVAFGCGLMGSELGLSGGFPVFLRNLLQWAVPQLDNPLADNPKVGEPGLRAEPGDWQVAGDRLSVSRLAGGLVRTVGRAPGLVSWSGGGDSGWLAVRLPASELDLAPRVLPGLGPDGADVQSGGTPRDPEGGGLVLRTELDLTAWCLVLAILVLGLEWLLWQGALKRRR